MGDDVRRVEMTPVVQQRLVILVMIGADEPLALTFGLELEVPAFGAGTPDLQHAGRRSDHLGHHSRLDNRSRNCGLGRSDQTIGRNQHALADQLSTVLLDGLTHHTTSLGRGAPTIGTPSFTAVLHGIRMISPAWPAQTNRPTDDARLRRPTPRTFSRGSTALRCCDSGTADYRGGSSQPEARNHHTSGQPEAGNGHNNTCRQHRPQPGTDDCPQQPPLSRGSRPSEPPPLEAQHTTTIESPACELGSPQ